jgi:histidine triad (HIT) family protein
MSCVFCDIINRKTDAEIIYEDSAGIAFLDIRPIHFGHVLVIPKLHYEEFIHIPEDCLSKLMLSVKTVTEALVKNLKPDGYNLFCNNRLAAGQSVFHFHFHIVPRYLDDEIKFKINFKKYRDTEMKELADKLRNEILINQ